MKKRSERRTHCALVEVIKAEPKKISPRRRPPSRGRRMAKILIITTFTYKPSLVKIDARNFELSW